MPRTEANGIELEFETFGHENHEPLLLIMGLGGQMLLWNEEFCEMLAEQGHFVIRFDNRDVGLSTWCDDLGLPDMMALFASLGTGTTPEAPYSLDDMADDAVAILDALGLERAHVCGASMGGMIAQATAIRHTDRVKSLTSIMSTTGNPDLPPPAPEAVQILTTPVPPDREAAIERSVAAEKVIGSPAYPVDPEVTREMAGILHDRAYHPEGTARQMAAIAAHGNRREALEKLDIPALVVHGKADALVPVEGGLDTHDALPNSELFLIEGMGHNMPRELWEGLVERISQLTRRAAS
ncbi:MAG: alpha/beta hydrolase [Spirochaeta sp.]|nr:alpha/beta hydrolase [Spirochaeta sp.]RPG10966.1 MAG: alpha/beta hydrolase [Proteobacteria bacterium TMED72]